MYKIKQGKWKMISLRGLLLLFAVAFKERK